MSQMPQPRLARRLVEAVPPPARSISGDASRLFPNLLNFSTILCMKKLRAMLLPLIVVLLVVTSCAEEEDWIQLDAPRAHADYSGALGHYGLLETSAGADWWEASERAFVESTRVLAPFLETAYLDPLQPGALAYEVPATHGQRIDISIESTIAELFVDVFPLESEQSSRQVSTNPQLPEPIHSWYGEPDVFSFEPAESGRYLVRIQPPLFHGGELTVSIIADAALDWPVPGVDRTRIWSFFGDARAGGARVHHGLDIFAPRGTPLVAVSPSRVMRVGERERGGNIVTLEDAERGLRIYYAHLDQQLVEQGTLAEPGDVVGTMGNTGNAITTPPHLHIGIYAGSWRRPVDPWYFFVAPEQNPVAPQPADSGHGEWVQVVSPLAPVRYPAARSGVIQSPARFDGWGEPVDQQQIAPTTQIRGASVSEPLPPGTPVRFTGARRDYYRIKLPDHRIGYLPRDGVADLAEPVQVITVSDTLAARSRPDATSDIVAEYRPGEEVAVLALHDNRYGLVLRRNGRAAWVELAELAPAD